jgi:hypothetical protein
MIRPIDIRLNAAHPELPLCEAVTYIGSPSTVLIRGVPPNCGRWAITAVFVAATFPDGSTTTRAAVQSANGVWVATLPATTTSGRTANGIRIMADGIDENGEAVTGYILGVADFAVASLGVAPAPEPGETSWQMLYFDAVPSTLRKGDVAKVDDVLKLYNGTAWEPFAAPVTFDDAVTRTSANGVKSSGIWSAIWGALASLPTGFTSLYDWCAAQLAGKASEAEAEALRNGKQDALSAQQLANIAAVPNKLDKSGGTFGTTTISLTDEGIAVSDTQSSNLTLLSSSYSFLARRDGLGVRHFAAPSTSGTLALTADIPYDLVVKTIDNGAVNLDDRAINAVAVSSSLASLTVNFPTATSGKARDFGLRLTVASGVTTAPQIVLPQGVVCENADGEAPEIGADGAATILYFTETASGVFLVKGEVLQTITA